MLEGKIMRETALSRGCDGMGFGDVKRKKNEGNGLSRGKVVD